MAASAEVRPSTRAGTDADYHGIDIVVLHLAGRYPLRGIGWQAIHYVLGLTRLGHDVYYVEDSGAHPYDPRVKSVVDNASYSVAFLADVMGRFGLADRASLSPAPIERCSSSPKALQRTTSAPALSMT